MNIQRLFLVIALVAAIVLPVSAAGVDAEIGKAVSLHEQGQFGDAYNLLVQTGAATSDTPGKTALANALANMGSIEYGIKNYKNAYDCFRAALKLNSSNQLATQSYLKIKKEMDVAKLSNDGKPYRIVVETPSPVAANAGTGNPAGTQPAASSAPVAAANPADLQGIVVELKTAEAKLNEAKTNESTSKAENELLKAQLEQQRLLVERMLESQRSAPSSNSGSSDMDSRIIQQTMALLAEIATKQANTTVVTQLDPKVAEVLQNMDKRMDESQNNSSSTVLVVIMIIVGVVVLALGVFLVLILLRARNARNNRETFRPDPGTFQSSMNPMGAELQIQDQTSKVALLEFSTPGGLNAGQGQELAIRKALVKADRLQKMYDEVRSGSISWETVRGYIDELDIALKTEILKVVESKLNSGDLVSNEAVLPIIFPFLTDYDSFLKDKAEKLAKLALAEPDGIEGESQLFSAKSLMAIPKQLTKLLKGRDVSLVTAKICQAIAKELALSKDECKQFYLGALAHDAGYLVLDANELQRIMGQSDISEAEFDLIKSHAAIGPQYFTEADVPDYMRDAMLYHHERIDGSGYPNGLRKDEIPLIAQVIGVAETFSSLISVRAHREKLNSSHALAIIKDGSRSKFDRAIVDALAKVVTSIGGL